MLISHSCSWCHGLNPADAERCQFCGHDAQRPRMDCTCPQCSFYKRYPEGPRKPPTKGESFA